MTKNKIEYKIRTTKPNNNSKNENSNRNKQGVIIMNIVKRKVNVKTAVDKSIERHPVPVLGIDYRVKIIYKNIKITELDVEDKTIKISLPNKYKKISNKEILDLAIEKMYEQIAIVEIERAMEKTRIMLGFAPEEYEIKKMKTLGMCKDRKITINPEIIKYNRKVIDYIVLHQYCHLKYKTHSKGFFNMLEKYQPDYRKCENVLMNI
ncbi:MAG: M48 family metallopeptidase [Clostridia bacterium]|nr:M48 family metallopeptidase [Clostridia bacterium]